MEEEESYIEGEEPEEGESGLNLDNLENIGFSVAKSMIPVRLKQLEEFIKFIGEIELTKDDDRLSVLAKWAKLHTNFVTVLGSWGEILKNFDTVATLINEKEFKEAYGVYRDLALSFAEFDRAVFGHIFDSVKKYPDLPMPKKDNPFLL